VVLRRIRFPHIPRKSHSGKSHDVRHYRPQHAGRFGSCGGPLALDAGVRGARPNGNQRIRERKDTSKRRIDCKTDKRDRHCKLVTSTLWTGGFAGQRVFEQPLKFRKAFS
jgi:hypothetical protein